MAFSLDQLRSKVLTSIHGRRFGLDKDGFAIGVKGTRVPVTDATSDTTGTALPNHGIVSVVTTTNDTWALAAPVAGCEVKIGTGSSSTGNHTVSFTGATCVSTNGIASSAAVLQGGGAYVALVGKSATEWMISSVKDSSGSSTVNFTS